MIKDDEELEELLDEALREAEGERRRQNREPTETMTAERVFTE